MLTIKNRAAKGRRGWLRAGNRATAAQRKNTLEGLGGLAQSRAFLVGTLCISIFSGCTPAGPKALLEGKRLIEQAKYVRAVEKLRTATSLLSTNGQAWNYLGLAYHYTGKPDDAERSYKRALSLNHDLTEAHYNLACLWLAQNKADKNEAAKTELLAYTLRRGNSVEGFLKLGLAQLRLREMVGAEKSFGDALRLSPQNPEGLNGMGLVRFQRGRTDEAVNYFRKALKQKPDYGPAILNLAIVAQESIKDRALASRAYREYIALKPSPPDVEAVRIIAGQLEQELNPISPRVTTNPVVTVNTNREPVKAVPTNIVFRGASSNRPKIVTGTNAPKPMPVEPIPPPANFETVRVAGDPVIIAAQGDPSPAAQTKAPVSEPLPQSTAPVNPHKTEPSRRGLFQRLNPLNLFKNEDKPSATTPLSGPSQPENALGNPSNSPTENVNGGRYLYHSFPQPMPGNRQEAKPLFDQAVRAQQARRLAEAMRGYTQAVEKDPSFFEAYYNLGVVAAEARDLSGALRAYENALAARADSLDARYNFALVLKQANYLSDAANELEKVVAAHPKESRAHLALGNLYAQQLSQPAKAREHYLLVLEIDPRNSQATSIRYWLTANPP